MYDLIIIGGGPAGIAAGIYATRKKLNTLLISRDFIGQVGKAFLIENYPGFEEIRGVALMERFKKHLEKFAIDINEGEEVSKISKRKDGTFEVTTSQKDRYFARAIIVASGRDPRPLEIPGEKEFLGRGVSYCTTCDAPLFQDKDVVVIGGGNSGFGAALELSKYCPKIYILHRGSKPRADEIVQERVKKTKKIKVLLNTDIKEIKGKNFVESIVYQDLKIKKQKTIIVQGVFVQIGSIPATGFVRGLVDFNEKDEIKIDSKTFSIKTPGLFAAGDVTDVPIKQIVVAAGEGVKAALSVYEYLQNVKIKNQNAK